MHWSDEVPELRHADSVWREQPLPAAAPALSVGARRDLSGLADVEGLRALQVDDARPEEVARLGALVPELTTLAVGGRHMTDLMYLAGVGAPSTLVLADHTKITSLDGIEVVAGSVRRLFVGHATRLSDLEALAALTELEELHLAMSMGFAVNGGRRLVDSLAPLAGLRKLRRLELFAVGARDKDLSPLFGLPALEEVGLDAGYPMEMLARLGGALGKTADEWPAVTPAGGCEPCRTCGGDKVRLTGIARGGVVCPSCRAERVAGHVEAFEAFRADQAGRPRS